MLPSTRELSRELEIDTMTVSKAYFQLEADGVVERVWGAGCGNTRRAFSGRSEERLSRTRRTGDSSGTSARTLRRSDFAPDNFRPGSIRFEVRTLGLQVLQSSPFRYLNGHHVAETLHHLVWEFTFLGAGFGLTFIGIWLISSVKDDLPRRTLGTSRAAEATPT